MNYKNLTIGVLALQGDFQRHLIQLALLGLKGRPVRLPGDLDGLDGLIMPGGESTTMNIMLDRFDMRETLTDFTASKPVWGTCAGMVLLAKTIINDISGVKPLGVLDIDVSRNGYGRQIFSFETRIRARLNGHVTELEAVFIRAPKVMRTGAGVKKLAVYEDSPVLVSSNLILASSFHTELADDTSLLEYFLNDFVSHKP
jgi:5'-phosphate synthase pdxT subunit